MYKKQQHQEENYFMNLIPSKPQTTAPNYWCTWATQALTMTPETPTEIAFPGDQGLFGTRDNLNSRILFGEEGWARDWEGIRGDLIFLIDDGWDVPYLTRPQQQGFAFGSLIVDSVRFPECTGTPAERLKVLNSKVRELGWRGLGIWVACQPARSSESVQLSPEEMEHYWTERLEWSREAGILLWKVDWGKYARDLDFRRQMTDLAHRIYPELLLEHACTCGPMNGIEFDSAEQPIGNGAFGNDAESLERKQFIEGLAAFSGVCRTYDTVAPLFTATTIERAVFHLQSGFRKSFPMYVCTEDPPYLGTALGCTLGIMRSSRWIPTPDDATAQRAKRCTETIRAIRMQRIAPAFPANRGEIITSSERLTDSWLFPDESTWFRPLWNKKICQSAPAVSARNMERPEVTAVESEKPFVVSTLHPNGTCLIATLPRLTPENGLRTPAADVSVPVDCTTHTFGIFGEYSVLRLRCSGQKESIRIFAQDLAADAAEEITGAVSISDGVLTIDGQLLHRIGTSAQDDLSDPGVVLTIQSSEKHVL